MSRVGLDWYKREPVAYLGDVQGLSSKEHAVYSVVIDLLYIHGGTIRNDPKFIAGWISDMGAAAVRTALAGLDANQSITLEISGDEISQKRAKSEVKTKQKQNGIAAESGRIGGRLSAEKRRQTNDNKDMPEADASNEIQPEKRREEKSIKEVPNGTSKKPARRAVSLPENWLPSDANVAHALSKGFSEKGISDEADKFRDYHLARGTTFKDWDAGWRTWIGNAIKFRGGAMAGRSQPGGYGRGGGIAGEVARRRLDG